MPRYSINIVILIIITIITMLIVIIIIINNKVELSSAALWRPACQNMYSPWARATSTRLRVSRASPPTDATTTTPRPPPKPNFPLLLQPMISPALSASEAVFEASVGTRSAGGPICRPITHSISGPVSGATNIPVDGPIGPV